MASSNLTELQNNLQREVRMVEKLSTAKGPAWKGECGNCTDAEQPYLLGSCALG